MKKTVKLFRWFFCLDHLVEEVGSARCHSPVHEKGVKRKSRAPYPDFKALPTNLNKPSSIEI